MLLASPFPYSSSESFAQSGPMQNSYLMQNLSLAITQRFCPAESVQIRATHTHHFSPTATACIDTMRQTSLALLTRKLITIPSLSPTHTSSRILSRLVPTNTHVIEYQPILTLQCSPDLIADPADRKSLLHEPRMLLESLEEGHLRWKKKDLIITKEVDEEQWYPVGTVIGEIIEDENDDGVMDFTAYDYNQDGEWDKFEKIS